MKLAQVSWAISQFIVMIYFANELEHAETAWGSFGITGILFICIWSFSKAVEALIESEDRFYYE